MERELGLLLREARRKGLRPFEVFREGKVWVDQARLAARGIVSQIEERTKAVTGEAEKAALPSQPRARAKHPTKKVEDEATGVGRDLGYAKGRRSHLLELRRAAIAQILRKQAERVEELREQERELREVVAS